MMIRDVKECDIENIAGVLLKNQRRVCNVMLSYDYLNSLSLESAVKGRTGYLKDDSKKLISAEPALIQKNRYGKA